MTKSKKIILTKRMIPQLVNMWYGSKDDFALAASIIRNINHETSKRSIENYLTLMDKLVNHNPYAK